MTDTRTPTAEKKPREPGLFDVLRDYRGLIVLLVVLAVVANGLSLLLPVLISRSIDAYVQGHFILRTVLIEFSVASALIYIFTYGQNIVQTYASERVARDLRTKLSAKISRMSYAFVQETTPAKLLTNLTSDIDAVKMFVAMAIASIVSSLFLIAGASILLLLLDWRLALAVLTIIPIIGTTFFFIFRKVRTLFKRSQEVIDWLNKVINESILGSAVIRVLHSQKREYDKFLDANAEAKEVGLQILRLFSALIPIITFISNLATLVILLLGGWLVIGGSMTIGTFAAFQSYLFILIFPILILGFMSNVIARAAASYKRVSDVLAAPEAAEKGVIDADIRGDIELQGISLVYGQKPVLKDASFRVKAGTKTAIIGPTGAGKTQLLYLLTGLIRPASGTVSYDGHPIEEYDKGALHRQVGFVFQDSVLFNLTLRENIAFSDTVKDEDLRKAIETAELQDFVDSLPEKLDTIVSERGTSLSGGQKQRIMLARALALNPRVLLLDDFTARVDTSTERKILANVERNYPGITLISVTQKIASAEHFEQIVLLMEGEVLARGTHQELIHTSPEYAQIYQSQQSTNRYEELRA
jgi:ATP-binding cassette subfamily B protein